MLLKETELGNENDVYELRSWHSCLLKYIISASMLILTAQT